MTHKVQAIFATPTLSVLLFLRPSVAHVACKTAYGQKNERGLHCKPPP